MSNIKINGVDDLVRPNAATPNPLQIKNPKKSESRLNT
jgi:hypothetical protein